ncbi:hypothetical protein ACFVH6_02955 [Spirillospora sp. NPDC127200]
MNSPAAGHPGLALAVTCVPAFMVALDLMVVTVALGPLVGGGAVLLGAACLWLAAALASLGVRRPESVEKAGRERGADVLKPV